MHPAALNFNCQGGMKAFNLSSSQQNALDPVAFLSFFFFPKIEPPAPCRRLGAGVSGRNRSRQAWPVGGTGDATISSQGRFIKNGEFFIDTSGVKN